MRCKKYWLGSKDRTTALYMARAPTMAKTRAMNTESAFWSEPTLDSVYGGVVLVGDDPMPELGLEPEPELGREPEPEVGAVPEPVVMEPEPEMEEV